MLEYLEKLLKEEKAKRWPNHIDAYYISGRIEILQKIIRECKEKQREKENKIAEFWYKYDTGR